MIWLGDYPEDFATVTCFFTTHSASGAAVAPLSAFEADDIRIYKNGDAAQKTSTNGITMTSPFDSLTGLHRILIDTSNDTGDSGFWTSGGGDVFTIVLFPDTETVDGVAITRVIGQFGINLSRALQPTTAGRKLDVTTGGEAGIDWGNIGNPTTAQNLSGTNIDTDQVVASVSGAVGSVTGSVGSVTGLTASDVGAIKTKTDFLPSATAGSAGGVFIAGTNAATTVTTSFTTTFTGNLTGTIGGLTAAALKDFFDTDSTTTYASAVSGSVVKEIADNAGGSSFTVQDIVDGVWDEPLADHQDAGSTGEALDAAASGGSAPSAAEIADAVWDEDATGHQTQGTFGQAIGDPGADTDTIFGLVNTNLNATVSSRATQTSVDTIDGIVDSILVDTGTDIPASIAALPTGDENADALLDLADAVEAGLTVRQAMRLSAAADGGKLSGGGTTTNTIRNAVADDTDRIIATVDEDGNRTAITYDLD